MITFGSLFAGIGGFDLGFERAGMKCVWQVENDPYAIRVLEKHWPNVRRFTDVREFPPSADSDKHMRTSRSEKSERQTKRRTSTWSVDIICGGFPCQPVSCAGKRQAQYDPRWLWPHFARIIRDLRPRYAVVENVPGLFVHGIGDVFGSLATMGYDAEWCVLPACAFGAPHPRERVFIVAYPSSCGLPRIKRKRTDIVKEHREQWDKQIETTADATCRGRTGINKGRKNTPRRTIITGLDEVAVAVGVAPNADCNGNQARIFRSDGEIAALPRPCWGSDQPGVVRASYGIPNRMDRIRCLGNAVLPQVSEFIGKLLVDAIEREVKGIA